MHSPAVALAWEFWGRHRWGLAGVVGLVAAFAVGCAMFPPERTTVLVHTIWFGIGLCYVIGVFAYGFEGRLETAESGFPARLFVLPVRTWVLVGWPMVQGMAAAVVLWLAWERLVLRPGGVEVPRWWPAMLAAVVAVSQAIVWFPFGLPWVRLIVAVGALSLLIRAPAVLEAVAGDRFADQDSQKIVLSLFAAALVPAAFLAAWSGVARARRGDSPDWLSAVGSRRRAGESKRERLPFASAMRAQVWYEWRLRCRAFVVTVAVVVAVLMLIGLLLERRTARADMGLMFLLIPPLIAAYWGSVMGSPGESVRSTALTAFAATRPLGNVALVSAKLRAATRAAVVTWVAVLAGTVTWIAALGGWDRLSLVWESAVERNGVEQVTGFCVLWGVVLVLGTWRALVANLWVGLAGRAWLVPAQTILLSLLVLQGLYEMSTWTADPGRRDRVLGWLPWAAGGLVAVKLLLACWLLRVLCRRGEVRAASAVRLFAVWAAAVAALFAVLAWVVPPSVVPTYGLALGVMLFVPLARLAAAPLALAWNRHR